MQERIEYDFRTAADSVWSGDTGTSMGGRAALDTSTRNERLVRAAVTRAKAGDPEAVRFLYVTYAGNVYSYVRTIVRHHHDAEDVTQQVFAKLLSRIDRYEPRQAAFASWLLRMAHNVAIDLLRTRRAIPAEDVQSLEARADEAAPERARCLREAMDHLPDDQRRVVVMRHVMGLSPAEIAIELGRSASSVNGLHHRGRRALREELAQLDSGPAVRAAA